MTGRPNTPTRPARRRRVAACALALALGAAGCAAPRSPAGVSTSPSPARSAPAERRAEENLRRLAVASARNYLGATRIVLEGRDFGSDCSAYVLGVYAPLGLDPVAAVPGVSRTAMIHRWHEDRGLTFQTPWPRPGDLAFFHNTYDRDRDGRADDLFTHIAVVERVEEDGTLVLLHRGSRGVGRFRMNLLRPGAARRGDRILNSVLKGRGGAPGAPRLAGQLFASFGRPIEAILAAEPLS